jgi:hypothetical protein
MGNKEIMWEEEKISMTEWSYREDPIPDSLYKFQSPNKNSFTSLKEKYFWFSTLQSLNDPWESYYKKPRKPPIDVYAEFLEFWDRLAASREHRDVSVPKIPYLKQANNESGLSAWYKDFVLMSYEQVIELHNSSKVFSCCNNFSCPPMWAHYSNNHRGWCVEFDPTSTFRNYSKEIHFWQQVVYKNEIPEFQARHFFKDRREHSKLVRTKASDWSYEGEWRAILSKDYSSKQRFVLKGIRSIIFGMHAEDSVIQKVLELTNKWRVKYYRAIRNDEEYRFDRESI